MSAHIHSLTSDTAKGSGKTTMSYASIDSATLHPDAERLLRKGLRRIAGLVLLLVALVLAGCASLPSNVQRPVSAAMSETAQTRLARVAAAATPQDKRHLSGFRLLPDGDHALNARIALIRTAQKSLDVQYYVIASDEVGLRFLRELRDAAERGVRVRLLVDDLYAAGQDELLAALAAHQNVQVRLFNPLPVRSGSFHRHGRAGDRPGGA
jgi:putative cardiolipin synthase